MEEPNKKLVDRMWIDVFDAPFNAFYAPLASSLNFKWSEEVSTAAVDGKTVFFNPNFFNSISRNQRVFVFMHEVEHVARLHHIRMGNRDPKIWNMACDYEINNSLVKTVHPIKRTTFYKVEGLDVLIDHKYDDMTAEQIYEDLIQEQKEMPNVLAGDMKPADSDAEDVPHPDIIQKVINANTAAEQASKAHGDKIPGYVDSLISTFARPVIPWTRYLTKFMTELGEDDYSWKKRNTKYQCVYIPSLVPAEGLAHIVFFYDVSGSVSKEQITRFNTEVAHVHKFFNPEKLTVVTFDTRIRNTIEFRKDEVLKDIMITGGGGTSLVEVYEYLVKHRPTAAVIFSDLECHSIEDPRVPILWGIIGNRQRFSPNFGTSIHIPNET